MQVIAAAFSAEVDGFAADPEVFLLFAAHDHFIYFAAVNAAQARLRAVKALVTGDEKTHIFCRLRRPLQLCGSVAVTAFCKVRTAGRFEHCLRYTLLQNTRKKIVG